MAVAIGVLVVIAFFVLIFLGSAVRVLREYERGVIFRLGRLIAQKGPGLILLVPVIDRMVRVDLRTVTLNVPPQEVITRDNVPARVDAVVYFRVINANQSIVAVENFLKATSQIAQTTLRSVLGKAELDMLLAEREQLNESLQQIIDDQTDPWGVKVTTVEIKDVGIPQGMQRAMARQAEAERERRAKIINAKGEFQAAAQLAEAADVISRNPATIQLRYLQTLSEIGVNQNSTVVFPLPMDVINPILNAIQPEAEQHASAILGMDIRGHTVHELWVERASDIASEYYASIVFDRSAKRPLVMLSTQGGMDIEEVAERDPDAIARLHVDPLLGFQDFHGRRLAFEAGVAGDVVRPIGTMLNRLYEAFVGEEAMLVEVNPLIVTKDREVMALDAKVTLDDNSLFRHPDNAGLRNIAAEDEQERMARERGLTYVKLDGNVGILGNGAGLVMSTLDVVAQAGGRPPNFLDAGGGSRAEAITQAVEVILSNANVSAVLFNIFGGITRCDEVARGLIEAFDQIKPDVPFVVRLDGTNDEEGRKLLAEATLPNVHTEATMLDAAKKVVELAG